MTNNFQEHPEYYRPTHEEISIARNRLAAGTMVATLVTVGSVLAFYPEVSESDITRSAGYGVLVTAGLGIGIAIKKFINVRAGGHPGNTPGPEGDYGPSDSEGWDETPIPTTQRLTGVDRTTSELAA